MIHLLHLEEFKIFVSSNAHLCLLDAQFQCFAKSLSPQVKPFYFAALLIHAYHQSSLVKWIDKVSCIIDHLSFLKISAIFAALSDWIKAQEIQDLSFNSTYPKQALFPY